MTNKESGFALSVCLNKIK